jgi:hypothetical protein
MNKYFLVVGTIDEETVELFGSFDRSDCVYELEAERDQWKAEGYKGIKLASKMVQTEPDEEVYEIVTSKELFQQQAPMFNFELNEEQLLVKALEVGFVSKVGDDKYLINSGY